MINKIKKAYKAHDYVLIKNAIELNHFGLNFDFNSLYEFLNTYPNVHYELKNNNIFMFQVHNIINKDTSFIFNSYIMHLLNILHPLKFKLGKLDFFFSSKGQRGGSHLDEEHVIILGVYKNTYYHIKGKDVKVCPGDILYIHKNILHHAFSSTERIILSLSLWDNND